MDEERHWENVYSAKSPEEMSWYEPRLTTSLEWIIEAASSHSSSIIDAGGGASTLVDDLYADGFRSLTVLDISPAAIAKSRERLGAMAGEIRWVTGDVTRYSLPNAVFDVWHDRAVFHFLTVKEDRDSYVKCVMNALKPSGQAIIATFSINGPQSCSGLPVSRYDAPSIQEQFGEAFRLVKSATVKHHTPAGASQEFLYCRMTRR
jgi:SAM-dependent methyltransferase